MKKKNKSLKSIFSIGLLFVPVLAFAQDKNLGELLNMFTNILVKSAIPLLVALATVMFVWGIIQYFINPDNEEKKKKGKGYMIWGLVGLFVMVTMWGLVGILSNTVFEGGSKVFIPQLSSTK